VKPTPFEHVRNADDLFDVIRRSDVLVHQPYESSTTTFEADSQQFYLGSADPMTRNLDRRIEVLVPVRERGERTHDQQLNSRAVRPAARPPGGSARSGSGPAPERRRPEATPR
jgi:polyphosphate kinase